MSYKDGMAAINLEMPDRIPRTEYSAHFHWDLVQKVTGLKVNARSTEKVQKEASKAFIKAWNYDFFWNIQTHNQVFDGKYTKLGHANFMAEGVDYSNDVSQLLKDPEDVFDLDLWELYGKKDASKIIKDYNDDYDKMCLMQPDAVNMTGIYISCMSGVLEILGWDTLLMAAGIDEKGFGDFINRYVEWITQYFEGLAASKAPVVMIHDDIVWTRGAFLKPEFYRTYIFPNYKKLFRPLIEAGKKIMFTSDGNYTQFADDIAQCNVNGFIMEPCTDMKYICEKYGKSHVIVGNADTSILLMKGRDEIEAEVKRCMDLGRNCPGYFLAVGNHIPSNTPVENALWYNECYEKYSRR